MGTERIFLADDAATAALGARLAARLKPGDLVLLSGGLGAGKTALARVDRPHTGRRSAARCARRPASRWCSPTTRGGTPLLHADLYRLRDAREIDELGLFDRADAIVLVEWPERAPDLARLATMSVAIAVPADGNGRVAEVTR